MREHHPVAQLAVGGFGLDFAQRARFEPARDPGPGLGNGHKVIKFAHFFRSGKSQGAQCPLAGPISAFIKRGMGVAYVLWNDIFRQIIEFAKPLAPAHGDAACAPQIFEGGFRGVPIPPTAGPALFIRADFPRS